MRDDEDSIFKIQINRNSIEKKKNKEILYTYTHFYNMRLNETFIDIY